jgi:WD40 repeat protein
MIVISLSLRGRIVKVDRDLLISVHGTYFYGLLASGAWQPNGNGDYEIDLSHLGFDRILECLSTGVLDCTGLSRREIKCVYKNLHYFLIPFRRVWNYSEATLIHNAKLYVHLELDDGRLCGSIFSFDHHEICVYNMDHNMIELRMEEYTARINGMIQLDEHGVLSCSDGTPPLRIWNLATSRCDIVFGHTSDMNCVIQLMDSRLCSGSSDMTIKVWNRNTQACELCIHTVDAVVCIVELTNGSLCGGEYFGNICIWN